MFTDDTNLFFTDKCVKNMFKTMNNELRNISNCFRANKLSLNVAKTKYSLFHSARKKVPDTLPKLEISDMEIKRDTVTKFLGVFIDENLTWKPHIGSICKKISKNIGILYKARPYINASLLKQLYSAFIHSHLNYCNIAWASTHKTKLERLYRQQKHAIRLINSKDRYSPSKPLFLRSKILNILDINIFQTLCLLFKCKMKTAPRVLHYVYSVKQPNKYVTRSQGKLHEPFFKTQLASFSFPHRGPYLWNKLISNNEKLSEADSFKHSNYV